MMQYGLHSTHEMDQVDVQQSYSTSSTDYDMKRERREIVMEGKTQPFTKRLKSDNHNNKKIAA
jgi:hypothetical protein